MRSFTSGRGTPGLWTVVGAALLGLGTGPHAKAQSWASYALNSQHSALRKTASQVPQIVRWSTPMDQAPQFQGNDLLIHYGSPLVTSSNTVIVPVKTGADDGFQVEAHAGLTGSLLWALQTDYSVPTHNWTPVCGCTLLPDDQAVAIPAGGGTVLLRSRPDRVDGSVTRMAFYGIQQYQAQSALFNATVKISTPITADAQGNLYFGFVASGAPSGLQSGVARLSARGEGTWVSVPTAAHDPAMKKVAYNCAPALNEAGDTLYVAVNNVGGSGFGAGYLLALDSKTLALRSKIFLRDAKTPSNAAIVADDGTASPTVGPDGDVYYGVLENPIGSNHLRGWMLHFDGALAQTRPAGAFGWDDTASLVPADAVPSYRGTSSYLLLTKYNNYVEGGGDGVNRLAILDPHAQQLDPITGARVMREVLTIAGPTPDAANRTASTPSAVREWCINTAAIDASNQCAVVNSEDGSLYRWDFKTNTLAATVSLTTGVGEAYTPTVIGPDGAVYAINNATLFACSARPGKRIPPRIIGRDSGKK